MLRPANAPGSIGLPAVSTNLSGNEWKTTHDLLLVGSFGMNGSVDKSKYNDYTIALLYLGVVNSTNTLYAQQPPIIAVGRLTYTYANQNM